MITFIASLLTLTVQPDAYQLNRQGRELLEQRQNIDAIKIFKNAADRADAELGSKSPATAMILRNLALAYVESGKIAAAEKSAHRAYAIIESQFGSAEPGLTPILNVLAECYASTGRIGEAAEATKNAVAIGPLAGAHFGTALHNMGALREYSGDLEGAAVYYRRAIEVKIETLGAGHPFVELSRAALKRVERGQFIAVASAKLELAAE